MDALVEPSQQSMASTFLSQNILTSHITAISHTPAAHPAPSSPLLSFEQSVATRVFDLLVRFAIKCTHLIPTTYFFCRQL